MLQEEAFMPFLIPKIFRLFCLTISFALIASCVQSPSFNSFPLVLTIDEFHNQTALCVLEIEDQSTSLVNASIWKIYRDFCTENELRTDFSLSKKLKNGLTDLTVSISDCTIDGYREIQTLNDIPEMENIQIHRLGYLISEPVAIKSIPFDFSLEKKLLPFPDLLNLYDARIYLGLYAEDDLCLNSIPLTTDERELIMKIRSGTTKLYNIN